MDYFIEVNLLLMKLVDIVVVGDCIWSGSKFVPGDLLRILYN